MDKIVLPEQVEKLMTKFQDAGAEIYVVGGAVRDVLMGREVKDWDFTTNLTPEEIQKLFPKNSFYNNAYGTVSVVNLNKSIFEVTTFRTENSYGDSRHPDKVGWGKTLEEDAKRRDFTINALALDADGRLHDFHNGEDDLKNKIIRCVGEAEKRFREDALRMLRAIRIASQIKFTVEEKTLEAITKNAQLLRNIAGERIREELFLILKTDKPGDGTKMLKNSGLLAEIMSELLAGVEMKQKGHHVYDVWNHSLETLNNCTSTNPITRLAALLHDVGKPVVVSGEGEQRTFYNHDVVGARIAVRIGRRLRLSNDELDLLFRLVRWHMFTVTEMQTDKAVRRFIRNVTPEYIDEMIALRRGDRVGSGAKETSWRWERFKERVVEVQKQPFTVRDLKIDGHDVMKTLGIKPGKKVGGVLDKIFVEVEENPSLNERETLLAKIKNYA